MKVCQFEMKTALGSLFLVASDRGLRGLHWERQAAPLVGEPGPDSPSQAHLLGARRQLAEYLAAERRGFDLALDFSGTPFQESVWSALRGIPFGTTISYKELAARAGKPEAIRAAGTAAGKNPLCIIIPCHRVIASDGSLGGYVGGLAVKRRLLAAEAAEGRKPSPGSEPPLPAPD